MIDQRQKSEIIKKFGKNEKDSGSTEVQVAILTQRIKEFTEHLKTHKKDFQGKRGLLMLVGKRRGLLAYLKKQNLDKYRELIQELGIRG